MEQGNLRLCGWLAGIFVGGISGICAFIFLAVVDIHFPERLPEWLKAFCCGAVGSTSGALLVLSEQHRHKQIFVQELDKRIERSARAGNSPEEIAVLEQIKNI